MAVLEEKRHLGKAAAGQLAGQNIRQNLSPRGPGIPTDTTVQLLQPAAGMEGAGSGTEKGVAAGVGEQKHKDKVLHHVALAAAEVSRTRLDRL